MQKYEQAIFNRETLGLFPAPLPNSKAIMALLGRDVQPVMGIVVNIRLSRIPLDGRQ